MSLRETYENYLQLPQIRATLDTIAWAEGGKSYNTLYGGGTFSDLSRHPNRRITAGGDTSTAAGRYQFLYSTYASYAPSLGITDFYPHSQDLLALREADVKGGLNYFVSGDFVSGLQALGKNGRCAWAALPYAGCGQKKRSFDDTWNYYLRCLAVYNGNGGGNTTNVNPIIPANANALVSANNMNYQINSETNKNLTWYVVGALFLILLIE